MKSELGILLEIMESLLAGEIDCENAQVRVNDISIIELQELYGNLHHYFDDEDIRDKDSDYKAFQDKELKKLINHLKASEIEKANGISFLHVS